MLRITFGMIVLEGILFEHHLLTASWRGRLHFHSRRFRTVDTLNPRPNRHFRLERAQSISGDSPPRRPCCIPYKGKSIAEPSTLLGTEGLGATGRDTSGPSYKYSRCKFLTSSVGTPFVPCTSCFIQERCGTEFGYYYFVLLSCTLVPVLVLYAM
jgi:hypothetical protein